MIANVICWFLGHHYDTYLIDNVDGQLWATHKICERCGFVSVEEYHRLFMLSGYLERQK